MLLYYLNYDYYPLCSHCERGWEYEDEGKAVPSIKKLLYNSIKCYPCVTVFSYSKVSTYDLTIRYVKLELSERIHADCNRRKYIVLWESWEKRIFPSGGDRSKRLSQRFFWRVDALIGAEVIFIECDSRVFSACNGKKHWKDRQVSIQKSV